MHAFEFIIDAEPDIGFREGAKGTHTSRTIMLTELARVLSINLTGANLKDAVLTGNALEKTTTSGRALTLQRLKELYGLDDSLPLSRVLKLLWVREPHALPLLALLAALARDPLLRATAKPVVGLAVDAELMRDRVKSALVEVIGSRLSDATLDKVVRNASSSWTQAGHLTGRTFKKRAHVSASPAAMAFAVWLAQAAGFKGEKILSSGWVGILDLVPTERAVMLERARSAGLVHVRQVGSHQEIDASHLSASRG